MSKKSKKSKKVITLVFLGDSGKYVKEKIGHVVGCQYAWFNHHLDRISMLDKEEWFVEKFKLRGKNIYQELNSLNKPVIVQKKWKKLKNQQIYPLKQIIKKFGIDYFTCSQAYLLALALYEGYDEIHLVGWDNYPPDGLDHEWNNVVWDEVCCQNFWVGFAKGMGVKIVGGTVAVPLTLYNNGQYAYNVSSIHKRKRKEILDGIRQRVIQEIKKLRN